MNEKINRSQLIEALANDLNIDTHGAEQFVDAFFDTIGSGLDTDGLVKIKNLGTFKLTPIETRESIDIHTGERIEIAPHHRVTFTPDRVMANLINAPFAQFATVVLDEKVQLALDDASIGTPDAGDTPIAADATAIDRNTTPRDALHAELPEPADASERVANQSVPSASADEMPVRPVGLPAPAPEPSALPQVGDAAPSSSPVVSTPVAKVEAAPAERVEHPATVLMSQPAPLTTPTTAMPVAWHIVYLVLIVVAFVLGWVFGNVWA